MKRWYPAPYEKMAILSVDNGVDSLTDGSRLAETGPLPPRLLLVSTQCEAAFTAKPKALAHVAPRIGTASPSGLEADPSPTARR